MFIAFCVTVSLFYFFILWMTYTIWFFKSMFHIETDLYIKLTMIIGQRLHGFVKYKANNINITLSTDILYHVSTITIVINKSLNSPITRKYAPCQDVWTSNSTKLFSWVLVNVWSSMAKNIKKIIDKNACFKRKVQGEIWSLWKPSCSAVSFLSLMDPAWLSIQAGYRCSEPRCWICNDMSHNSKNHILTNLIPFPLKSFVN